jgi:hypothetical protein
MMKVNWLKQEAMDGKFKGLEMELAREPPSIALLKTSHSEEREPFR